MIVLMDSTSAAQGDSSDVDRRKNYEFVRSLESFVLDSHRRKIKGE